MTEYIKYLLKFYFSAELRNGVWAKESIESLRPKKITAVTPMKYSDYKARTAFLEAARECYKRPKTGFNKISNTFVTDSNIRWIRIDT